jgi:hypothetical protein
MTKREIARSIKKLAKEVKLYHDKCVPISGEERWSAILYAVLTTLSPPPKAKTYDRKTGKEITGRKKHEQKRN